MVSIAPLPRIWLPLPNREQHFPVSRFSDQARFVLVGYGYSRRFQPGFEIPHRPHPDFFGFGNPGFLQVLLTNFELRLEEHDAGTVRFEKSQDRRKDIPKRYKRHVDGDSREFLVAFPFADIGVFEGNDANIPPEPSVELGGPDIDRGYPCGSAFQ